MTIVEALRISDDIRRKSKPSHCGSHGYGFVNIDLLLPCRNTDPFMFHIHDGSLKSLTKEDLLANDWEAKISDKHCDVPVCYCGNGVL